MLNIELAEIYERDLEKVKSEILLYKSEEAMWIIQEDINNSAGNLCLHLIGNLNHFIGAILGKTGYVRTRELEFSSKNVPRSEIIVSLDKTNEIVKTALLSLTDKDLVGNYPIEKHNAIVTMPHMLLHLLTHLNYHLGQINYHRRLLDKG